MRKLGLSVDDLHVATFQTHAAGSSHGTVVAHQTEPASAGGPCTGIHCTYPIQLCHPRLEEGDQKKQQQR